MQIFADFFFILIFVATVIVIPGGLTVWNIYNLFSQKPKVERLAAWFTVLVGGLFYLMLFGLSFETAGNWYVRILDTQLHFSISSKYDAAVAIPVLFGFIGLLTLVSFKAEKLPPLVSALSIAFVILLNVIQIFYAIQLAENIEGMTLMLYIYHANIFILSVSAVKKQIKQQIEIFADIKYREQKQNRLYRRMKSISQYSALVFICLFLVIAVLEILFILTGQGADAPIKAFTDTADWTFSQQIPPPPKHYQGHYLCTVAAGGHKKVVKPLRLGTRHGATIVVNRQLCVANAFEDYIHEKLPRFHKLVRGAYDKYGYPISKHITTPRRADAVYILMKPLECVFLIFLYLFDTKPEQRISRQYLYKGENSGSSR